MNLFVTGTDTGVGKTHTVVQLLRLMRQSGESWAGFKPICCGDRRDAERLLEASDSGLTIDQINPLWLKTPAAPIVAAKTENVKIDVARLIAAFSALRKRVQHIVVEGVGGWLVPIRRDYFVSDLAGEMKLPVVVVVQNRLGCLNHAALTEKNIESCGLCCAALVLNAFPDADDLAVRTNANVLREIIRAPVLGGLTERMRELPSDWSQMIRSIRSSQMSVE